MRWKILAILFFARVSIAFQNGAVLLAMTLAAILACLTFQRRLRAEDTTDKTPLRIP